MWKISPHTVCVCVVVALMGVHAMAEVEMMEGTKVAPLADEELMQVQGGKDTAQAKSAEKGEQKKKVVLPDPPQVIAKAPPTLLEKVLKTRRHKRLRFTAHKLRMKFLEAKVARQAADAILSRKLSKYKKSKTEDAEARSAKSAARKKQRLLEQQIIGEHEKVMLSKTEFKKINRAYKLAKAMVRGEKIYEQVASAFAQSGGAKRNLKHAEKRRQRANDKWKAAKANIEARKKGVAQAKLVLLAGKADLKSKKEALHKMHRNMRKADQDYSGAMYQIHNLAKQLDKENEDVVQYTAEAKTSDKAYKEAHALASAAALKLNRAKNGDEATLKALLGDPEEERKEALARVQDQDGISSRGTALVAADGAVSADYIKRFDAMPIGNNGRNPILEAEAAASVKDKAEEATKAATTTGPATLAAPAAIAAADFTPS